MIRTRIALMLALVLGGCGGSNGGSDPETARVALESALNAWRRGETTASLSRESPAVHVADYRWEAGFQLTKYEIADSTATSGFDRRYPVQLWLTTPKGKTSRETAVYNVATSPAITVVRDPES